MMNMPESREICDARPGLLERLRGVILVLATPCTARGELDLARFRRLSSHVLGTGVTDVMFPDFGSEFYKLSSEERHTLLDAQLEETAPHPSVWVIVSVAEQAPASPWLRPTLRCGGAPRPATSCRRACFLPRPTPFAPTPAPVIVQVVPGLTGAQVSVEDLRALAAEHGSLRIVKVETSPAGRPVAVLAEGRPALSSLVRYRGSSSPMPCGAEQPVYSPADRSPSSTSSSGADDRPATRREPSPSTGRCSSTFPTGCNRSRCWSRPTGSSPLGEGSSSRPTAGRPPDNWTTRRLTRSTASSRSSFPCGTERTDRKPAGRRRVADELEPTLSSREG